MKNIIKKTFVMAFVTILLGSCSESKTNSEEKTEINTMDSVSKNVEKSIDKLEEQTKKVEKSVEKIDKEF